MKLIKLSNKKFYEVMESELNSVEFKKLLNTGKIKIHHYSTGFFYYKFLSD
jgi:hypothetical protein